MTDKNATTKPAATRPMPPLTDEEARIILHKGTERPFTGKYWKTAEPGAYICRQCGAELYRSKDKFESGCGWPSFDDEIPGAVKRQTDADGRRTEILCANCDGHLGHVFEGERLTAKNTRHCVNSASIVLEPLADNPLPGVVPAGTRTATQPATQKSTSTKPAMQEAIFAGGCFWGVEFLFAKQPGVISATSGYTGGKVANPTYKQVCSDTTGHAEAVKVVFDPAKISYEKLARYFFEIHDPTEVNRQGPDVGLQYRSAIFYHGDEQKKIAEKLIAELKAKGYKVATQVVPAETFYPAEDYHQDYFSKHPEREHCHAPVNRFEMPLK